eukprot:CAMPEP_0170192470 /NCGR_PEP_ID=MMETSP0040_2-20121228/54312_1 /TAXON_ID=641309 /ORGANISM="Lotharella oceanica, Strain CCMP622" /LENGTH=68 /DNA_ID=CAMNT_0010440861 /DNA_START=285 /DNA_END=491 /DNA_ORIENTATION=+
MKSTSTLSALRITSLWPAPRTMASRARGDPPAADANLSPISEGMSSSASPWTTSKDALDAGEAVSRTM